MKKLIGVFAVLGLSTGLAFADDEAPPAPAADKPVAEDCSKLEADAKAKCEADQAAAAAAPVQKGSKLQPSTDNHMESLNEDNN